MNVMHFLFNFVNEKHGAHQEHDDEGEDRDFETMIEEDLWLIIKFIMEN